MVSWPYSDPHRIVLGTGVKHDKIFCSWPRFLTLAARRTRARPPRVMCVTQRDPRKRTEVNRVDRGDMRTPYGHDNLTMNTHPVPANVLHHAHRAEISRKIVIWLCMVSAYHHYRLD